MSREDRVKSNDWLSHRSTESWPSRLHIPFIDEGADGSTLGDYYVPYQEPGDGDIQWYFYAISGAQTKHYKGKIEGIEEGFDKDYTLPEYIYDLSLGRIITEVKYTRTLPQENEVFNYIDDPEEIDYVFMSLGGNDANFAEIVTDVVIHSPTIAGPLYWLGTYCILKSNLDKVWNRREEIIDDIETVIQDIHKNAQYATIIQTGYPKLYADESAVGFGWFTSKNVAKLVNDKVSGFNDLIRERIESLDDTIDVRFVDIEEKFEGHSAYSHNDTTGPDGAWLNHVILLTKDDDINRLKPASDASMHPNTYGADAYAEAVNEVIMQADADRKGARSISGVITVADGDTDMTNNLPLAGANIKLDWYNPATVGPNPSYSTVSDENGNYRLFKVVPGRYSITVSKDGYQTVTDVVTISGEEATYYSVALIENSKQPDGEPGGDTDFEQRSSYRAFESLLAETQEAIRKIKDAMIAGDNESLISMPNVSQSSYDESRFIYTMLDGYKMRVSSLPHADDFARNSYSMQIRPENGIGLSYFVVTGNNWTVNSTSCPCVNWNYHGDFLETRISNGELTSSRSGKMINGLCNGLFIEKTYSGAIIKFTYENGIFVDLSWESNSGNFTAESLRDSIGKLGIVDSGSLVWTDDSPSGRNMLLW